MVARTGKIQAVGEHLGHADPATTLRFCVRESLTDKDPAVLGRPDAQTSESDKAGA